MDITRSRPFVGREQERDQLRLVLAEALLGQGRLVLVGGEAGIGKTALIAALADDARRTEAVVLWASSSDLVERTPLGLWRDLLAPLAPISPEGVEGTGTGLANGAALDWSIATRLANLAETQPLVLILDDLHWADRASLDLLRSVARVHATRPTLIVAAYRTDEIDRLREFLPAVVRETQPHRLELKPLDSAETAQLLADRYGPDMELSSLLQFLESRADGNPFVIEELLYTLESNDLLVSDGAAWRVGEVERCEVPPLLRQMFGTRLVDASETERHLLSIAAVLGREVSLEIWAAVAGVEDETILRLLDSAEGWRVLHASRDGARARFCHGLLRELCYETALPARRRTWHKRAAEALASRDEANPGVIADHFKAAGDPRAVEWLALAGRLAEARALGERTISADSTQTSAWLGLGLTYAQLGTFEHARQAFGRARLSDAHALFECVLVGLPADGSLDQACKAALQTLSRPAAPQALALARTLLGQGARAQGRGQEAWRLVHAGLPDGQATQPGSAMLTVALSMHRLAAELTLDQGDTSAARAWLEGLDRWLAWSSARLWRAEAYLTWARYHRACGDLQSALQQAQAAFIEASAPRQPLALLIANRVLGQIAFELGQLERAGDYLNASLQCAETCSAPLERALTLLALAELHHALGNVGAASVKAAEAREVCAALGAALCLAQADALLQRFHSSADGPRYPAGLSAREVEVLRLVADGHTNREIAHHLVLSERTVPVHVRNILTKTNSANRAAAAAFALRNGLA
jgi:ATP/maltotriose-dependent transcriptional regulator MalT